MSTTIDAVAEFDAAVKEVMRSQGLARGPAMRAVSIAQPNLHSLYLQQFSAAKRGSGSGRPNAPPVASTAYEEPRQRAVADPEPAAEFHGDAIARWNAAVADLMKSQRLDKPTAVRTLVVQNPALHKAFVAAYDEKWGEAVRHPSGQSCRRVV